MTTPVMIIARYTFIEGLRNRLFSLMLIAFVCGFGLVEFFGALALTETREIQSAFAAALSRWMIVFVIALFVTTSMVREFNDKGLELFLSLPLRRSAYFFGKLLGFLMLAVVVTVFGCLLLLLYAPLPGVLAWGVSLGCELAIVTAASLLCLFTFTHVTPAFSAVAAFYVLARSIHDIQLISQSPLLETGGAGQIFIEQIIRFIALVLPDFSVFTRTAWLVNQTACWQELAAVLIQTLIYTALLCAAALFDFHRKNI